MSNVQLPGSFRFDSQIKIHTGTENKDLSLAKEFKDHLEGQYRQNGVIDQGKPIKIFMEIKCTERKYHVQDNVLVELKDVKMYCNINQFPALPFCGPHSKPHSARGISKHYQFRFYTTLFRSEPEPSFCCQGVWNVYNRRVMLGIDLCYNTFSHL